MGSGLFKGISFELVSAVAAWRERIGDVEAHVDRIVMRNLDISMSKWGRFLLAYDSCTATTLPGGDRNESRSEHGCGGISNEALAGPCGGDTGGLAEDVVLMPPGEFMIVGIDAVREASRAQLAAAGHSS